MNLPHGGVDHIEVEGLRIADRRAGDGPPLFLLHGGPLDSREWRRQLDELSDEFTVVAWDAPGCGRSSDPPETFRSPQFADCLAAFIDALGLGRPHVAGLSFGVLLGEDAGGVFGARRVVRPSAASLGHGGQQFLGEVMAEADRRRAGAARLRFRRHGLERGRVGDLRSPARR